MIGMEGYKVKTGWLFTECSRVPYLHSKMELPQFTDLMIYFGFVSKFGTLSVKGKAASC